MSTSIIDADFNKVDHKYASFGYRVGASLVDMLIFIPLIGISFYNTMAWKNLGIAILLALVAFFYKPLMEHYFGATLAWIISTMVNIYVIVLMFNDPDFYDANGFMSFSEYSQGFGPSAYNNYAAIVLVISIIFMFWETKKQTLHDKVAKTVVIKLP